MKFRWLGLYSLFVLNFYQCRIVDSGRTTRIELSGFISPGTRIYLSRVPYIDENEQVIDSATEKTAREGIVFLIPREDDRLYEIRLKDAFGKVYFIADAPLINIRLNGFSGKSVVTGSPATHSLNNFHDDQHQIAQRLQQLRRKTDSLIKAGSPDKKAIDLLQKNIGDSLLLIRVQNLHYADTVKNPAAFLAVYNTIDFDDRDQKELKQFILRNASRFPQSRPVQKLREEVLAMVSIFEEEFNIGDQLPTIRLPDAAGQLFSTSSLKGKYYLINFWSTWCQSCMVNYQYQREAGAKIPSDRFAMVSVALDDNKQTWLDLVKKRNDHWLQLIDEKMWRGEAVRTLKFDSIPFNFLVSPDGRILAKAIKPDSLAIVLHKLVH
jgi:hypothetical protein